MKRAAIIILTLTLSTVAWPQCVIQLTDNDYDDDMEPRIHNGQIVWSQGWIDESEIFFWDGIEVTQITDNDVPDRQPQIYDGQVAWMVGDIYERYIYFWDGTEVTQITNEAAKIYSFSLHKGTIVWAAWGSEPDYEIYYWNGTSTLRLTDNDFGDWDPDLDNGQIVWSGSDGNDEEIFFWDGAKTIQLTDNDIDDYFPKIHNGQITWMGGTSYKDGEIFFYDGEIIHQLTDNDIHDAYPEIHSGQIAWVGGKQVCDPYPTPADALVGHVYFYDGEQVLQVTQSRNIYFIATIQNGSVLYYWSGVACPSSSVYNDNVTSSRQQYRTPYREGEIFLWNGTTTILVGCNIPEFTTVDMDDGTVVWDGWSDSCWIIPEYYDMEIFMSCRTHDRPVERPGSDSDREEPEELRFMTIGQEVSK